MVIFGASFLTLRDSRETPTQNPVRNASLARLNQTHVGPVTPIQQVWSSVFHPRANNPYPKDEYPGQEPQKAPILPLELLLREQAS